MSSAKQRSPISRSSSSTGTKTTKRRPFSKPGKELILKDLANDPSPKLAPYQAKWKKGNEERMLDSLSRFGHLQMRVKFELLEEDGNGRLRYGTLAGRTMVFKRIATQGSLLAITQALAEAGVEEAKRWTKRRKNDN